jgi:hypothetical protein
VSLSQTIDSVPSPTTAAVLVGCSNGEVALVCVDVRGAVGSTSWSLHR